VDVLMYVASETGSFSILLGFHRFTVFFPILQKEEKKRQEYLAKYKHVDQGYRLNEGLLDEAAGYGKNLIFLINSFVSNSLLSRCALQLYSRTPHIRPPLAG
jgi:hypothetical protein